MWIFADAGEGLQICNGRQPSSWRQLRGSALRASAASASRSEAGQHFAAALENLQLAISNSAILDHRFGLDQEGLCFSFFFLKGDKGPDANPAAIVGIRVTWPNGRPRLFNRNAAGLAATGTNPPPVTPGRPQDVYSLGASSTSC